MVRSWNGKPYHSLDYALKEQFGRKIYKLALDGGMTCPNRDGTLGLRGCIFCSHGGSGDFAVPRYSYTDVWEQIEAAKGRVAGKIKGDGCYIAYFQSYTNTYASAEYLETLFERAIGHPDVVGLSIGTRPDCLNDQVVGLLKRLNDKKPVWIELGLQTIHDDVAEAIGRGYPLSCFQDAYARLKEAGLTVIVHVILGLPGETKEMMLDTVRFLGGLPVDGIKLQLLHVLKGTELAARYEREAFPLFTMEEYIDLVIDCIAQLPPEVVVHRISGDGPKDLLLAPVWSGNKRLLLGTMSQRFVERGVSQGDCFINEIRGE